MKKQTKNFLWFSFGLVVLITSLVQFREVVVSETNIFSSLGVTLYAFFFILTAFFGIYFIKLGAFKK